MINRKAMAEAERADYEERTRQFWQARPYPEDHGYPVMTMGLAFAGAAALIVLVGTLLVGG